MKNCKKCYVYIAMAGLIWSSLGLFGNILMARGLSSEQVAFTRLFIGFITLSIYAGIRKPHVLKLNKKGLMYCVAIGIICQGFFNMCYFKAVEVVGVSIAAVLLYTSPLFLAFFSKLIYKERITRGKAVSLILCVLGAIMAVTGGKFDVAGVSSYGILMGILAAVTYALMPTISKNALKDFSSETLLIYGFLFGAIFMIPSAKPWEMVSFATDINVMPFMMLLGIFPAALAYIFYAGGISLGAELSIVGVVASIELVAASFIGWIFIGEPFSIGKLIGVAIMFVSAIAAVSANDTTEEAVETSKGGVYTGALEEV